MNITNTELTYAAALVLILVGVGSYTGWRQWKMLRGLAKQEDPDDRRYYRSQAYRRLIGSVLMLALAGLLVGSYGLGMESRAAVIGEPGNLTDENQVLSGPNAEQRRFLNLYSWLWIVFGMLLFSLVSLALYDMWSTRSFWLRQYRQIQADRRAMIERQVARLRSQRNGE